MLKRVWYTLPVFCLISAVLVAPPTARAEVKTSAHDQAAASQAAAEDGAEDGAKEIWAPAVKPKPLSDEVKKGLKWVVARQLNSGGWGQGDESQGMQGSSRVFTADAIDSRRTLPAQKGKQARKSKQSQQVRQKPSEIPSVADTCMATLALIRSGSTPSKGEYAEPIARAIRYLCCQIEEADEDTMYITKTRGTRVQSKLGPFIDTFMAAMVLPEIAGKMPSEKDNARAQKALLKVMGKMKKNQRQDGTWSDQGWAATLAQGVAAKGMNRAAQSSFSLAEAVDSMREKSETNAQRSFDSSSGKFSSKGSAGVQLYSAGANLSALSDNYNTNEQQRAEVEKKAKSAATPQASQAARQKLDKFRAVKRDLKAAQAAVVKRLDDKAFIAGFGNNGGEEFLSYMNIGEGLVVKGGDAWKTWDKSITENLNRIQNNDGSWSGHHCITGRTFCTSASLLVLMVDRAPMPVASKVKGR